MEHYDIAIIGAGLVGAALAFDLHRAGYKVVVLEASHTVCGGVSCTNSGMLHTGFDSEPETLETRCILRQGERWPQIFDALGIPYQRQGALLLAKNSDEADQLAAMKAQAVINGVEVQILNQTKTLERSAGAQAVAGLLIPAETITDPYWVTWSLLRGIAVRLGAKVTWIETHFGGIRIRTNHEQISARFAVNCAGLFADEIVAGEIRITPRRGEFVVYAKGSAALLHHILLPVPNKFTKGVLLFPTLYGHLCAGPTAVDEEDKLNWTPRREALEDLHRKSSGILPALRELKPVDAWAGLRTVGHPRNYYIEFSHQIPNLLHVAGIRSTGLSACLGISEYAIERLQQRGLKPKPLHRGLKPKPLHPAIPDPTSGLTVATNMAVRKGPPWWERHNTNHRVDSKTIVTNL